jgi:hypothetical protein
MKLIRDRNFSRYPAADRATDYLPKFERSFTVESPLFASAQLPASIVYRFNRRRDFIRIVTACRVCLERHGVCVKCSKACEAPSRVFLSGSAEKVCGAAERNGCITGTLFFPP